jgi:hypothetical protein
MSKYSHWTYSLFSRMGAWIAAFEWTKLVSKIRGGKPGFNLTEEDWNVLKLALADSYYIILTRRKTHLSTYLVCFMTFVKTLKWPQYTHALMNLDLVSDPEQYERFKLMEATGSGVHFSRFEDVFNCDYVCLLQPRKIDPLEWESVMRGLASQLGKPYDMVFDLKDDSRVSCVEMCLDALRDNPNYKDDCHFLENMVHKVGNLTPQMFRECDDFDVILEIKR